ncbi:MAG: hypothetical protein NVSMB3_04330 [Acidobacteriaceae bacterium]
MRADGPRAQLSRRYHLSASHRLHTEQYDAERNREVFGKCNNPHGHGHNYIVEVTFSGPVDGETGMVTNLADLDGFAREELMDVFHEQNLNTLPCFAGAVSTTENFAREIYRIFSAYPHARLERVHVDETPNNSFDYAGGDMPEMTGRGR